jgi:aromatic-L-amino-acid decarboxylase
VTPEEFRRAGHQVVDWIARYMDEVERYPVQSQVQAGEIRASLPGSAPEQGEPFEAMLADVEKLILPGITHWQSPNFFGYFPCNASGPAILGELLSAGLGVNGMLWSTSPACTELETLVLDWLVDMLDLPEKFASTGAGGGVLQDSASSAVLCALLASRERATGFSTNASGIDRRLRAYTSREAHSSVEKAVRIAGLGSDNLLAIDVDANLAMRPMALESAIRADIDAGHTPCFVCATSGTTSSTAFDPLGAIGEVCRRYGVWMHVDAAYAGTAALCPELRFVHEGLEAADSYCFNPHKWMLTNFDCDCFYVADRELLTRTLSILPEYLRGQTSTHDAAFDYRDWQIPLGRRFRSLKLWFTIRHFGIEGLREHVRKHVALGQEFAGWVEEDPDFELVAPAPLNLVCFRLVGSDERNRSLLDALNASGELLLSHTRLDGRFVLRMAIGGARTERRHTLRAWELIRAAVGTLPG